MAWTLTGDVAEYLTAAGDFLRARAAENTVQLAATETIRVRGAAAFGDEAPLFGWWAAPGAPVGAAFMHTPPYGLALTGAPAGVAAALAGTLAARGRFPAWVMSDPGTAQSFAAAWERHTGQPARAGTGGSAGCCRRTRRRPAGRGSRRPPTPACSSTGWRHSAARWATTPGLTCSGRWPTGSATAASRCGRPMAGPGPWPG